MQVFYPHVTALWISLQKKVMKAKTQIIQKTARQIYEKIFPQEIQRAEFQIQLPVLENSKLYNFIHILF